MFQKGKTIQWQPISMLPLLIQTLSGMRGAAEEQKRLFEKANAKPGSLDNVTVQRAQLAYQGQLENLLIFKQQAQRWQETKLSEQDTKAVQAFLQDTESMQKLTEEILQVLENLAGETIEKLINKSDAELGAEFLRDMKKKS